MCRVWGYLIYLGVALILSQLFHWTLFNLELFIAKKFAIKNTFEPKILLYMFFFVFFFSILVLSSFAVDRN